MDNKTISRKLRLLSQLMELHNENSFKVKSMANAAFKVDKLPFAIALKTQKEISEIQGIGASTAAKIAELLTNNSIAELDGFVDKTPPGILEIMHIKGIGPKKVSTLWTELGIETIGELLYACNENRLIEAKGFGLKTQEEIKKAIEFAMASNGRFLYARVEPYANQLLNQFQLAFPTAEICIVGEYRRRCEIIDTLAFLITASEELVLKALKSIDSLTDINTIPNGFSAASASGITLIINFCTPENFAWQLFIQTGNALHVDQVLNRLEANHQPKAKTEQDIYSFAKLDYIEPEMREGLNEIKLSESKKLPQLITYQDLKGTLHNHSTWSDGVHTLEEMALFCRDELKLQYLGISDHSKTAFYAKGLKEEQIIAQHLEIELLNKKLSPFKIFKGIESDILFDGSLDYAPDVLASFDFVVASIHSVFRMSEEKATTRLIKAIENPYTTILGHPTGRLLLSRNGYAIDYKKVIDACAANSVVIEINSNPLRLDLDWRWHQYALSKGVVLSINPDAHRKDGFLDMHYGILIARKGGVGVANCLNAMSLQEITAVFAKKKSLTTA